MDSDSGVVVLAVRSDSFSGVERYVCDIALELALRGWQVQVVGGDERRMQDQLGTAATFSPAASTREVARALRRAPREAVVHVHMTAAEVGAILADPGNHRGFVTTRHFAGARGSRVSRMVGPAVRRGIRQQIAISTFVADSLGEPSVVIHNGVRNCEAAAVSAPVITMLQRLNKEKDPLTGIRAWAQSRLQDDGWRLQVAGRGQLDAALAEEVARLGVSDSVDLLGFVDNAGSVLDGTSVLLATAPAEPFGLSVVESMARAVPVVAADGGAHRETVGDETGSLFRPGDVSSCAALLRGLAEDRGLRQTVGRHLQQRQRRLFDLTWHVERLESLYRAVLADSRAS